MGVKVGSLLKLTSLDLMNVVHRTTKPQLSFLWLLNVRWTFPPYQASDKTLLHGDTINCSSAQFSVTISGLTEWWCEGVLIPRWCEGRSFDPWSLYLRSLAHGGFSVYFIWQGWVSSSQRHSWSQWNLEEDSKSLCICEDNLGAGHCEERRGW